MEIIELVIIGQNRSGIKTLNQNYGHQNDEYRNN